MAQDNTIPHGKPGIASFESETWGGAGEPRFGDGPAQTVTRNVAAGADLDLPLYSVVSIIGGVLALAVLGAAGGSATGTVTFSSTGPVDGETVTINGRVYTFKDALTDPAVADEVLTDDTPANQAANLAAAINATASGAGVTYGTGTTINADVRATVAAGVVTLIALNEGDEGNSITLAKSATNTAVSGATLSGGDDDSDIKPWGILAAPVVMSNGDSMDVPIYVSGHWNMDALNWDDSWATDAAKQAAFEGSLHPTILISKPQYNDGGVPV